MSAHLIIRNGTLGTNSGFYGPGVHEIEDDAALSDLESATDGLPWAWIERNYVEPLQLEAGDSEEPQPALDTPGQHMVAETRDGDVVKGAAGKIEDALTPEEERPAPGFPCPYCDKNLRNEGARISHVKAKHEDKAEEFMADRRAAKEAGEHGWGENAEE